MVEAHISYLFLTGSYVYKVKKPMDFGFLDFTSLEKRRHCCHQETLLNPRLSPEGSREETLSRALKDVYTRFRAQGSQRGWSQVGLEGKPSTSPANPVVGV